MRTWRVIEEDRAVLFSPVGLRLLDSFTGTAPIGWVRAHLDLKVGVVWRPTDIRPVLTPSRVITFPGLGRRADPIGQPVRTYRVRLEAQYYRPAYRADEDGVEFDAPPYNDLKPPASVPAVPTDTQLLPSSAYRFPNHIRVLRGVVTDPSGAVVEDVLVTEGARENVLTDGRGTFSLPLRWPDQTGPVTINAEDKRTTRTGALTVALPGDLSKNNVISIS